MYYNYHEEMKKLFLCFLAVLLFAPDNTLGAGVSRAASRGESGRADTGRAVSTTRAASRTVSRTDTNRNDSASRTERGELPQNATRAVSNRAENRNTSRATSDVIQRRPTNSSSTSNAVSVAGQSRHVSGGVAARTAVKSRDTGAVKSRPQMSALPNDFYGTSGGSRTVARAGLNTTKKKITAESIAEAKQLLEQTASLNKSCQDQYNECMDQFCAVVDTNQKRCSCSANLAKYTEVQKAVTDANNELNEVAQRIRYVGLSADEIRAIMSETQAEAALDKTKDKSETRSMLDKIESLIQDPTATTETSDLNDFGLNLDLDFDFSSDSSDIFSLDIFNNGSDSISSKRGTSLYNAAKKRCKTILNNCVDVGATSEQITGNYELAIDKDCIAYEQGLKKMNETLKANVRSANTMLQKARLTVMQDKNKYDPKECISALETCMTDEMVCGEGYLKCLDPTKRYIDENGKIVLGQDISDITDFMLEYNNAAITNSKLESANSVVINLDTCKGKSYNDGSCVMKYLLDKIGTGATVKDGGLCRAVLDKCQQYTYNQKGDKYNPYNEVVVNYMQRAMVNIKSAQHRIISDYASTCMNDVADCYNSQVTQINSWSSVASATSVKGVMTGACRNIALTCAYAVFSNMCDIGDTAITWVLQTMDTDDDGKSLCSNDNESIDGKTACYGTTACTPCDVNHQEKCINGISEMFYQSLLCPGNSTFDSQCFDTGIDDNGTLGGCVNRQCRCLYDFASFGGQCMAKCANGLKRDISSGQCVASTSQNAEPDKTVDYAICEMSNNTLTDVVKGLYNCTGAGSKTKIATYDKNCMGADGFAAQGGCATQYVRCAKELYAINGICTNQVSGATPDIACQAADPIGTLGKNDESGSGNGCVSENFRCIDGFYVDNDNTCTEVPAASTNLKWDSACVGKVEQDGCSNIPGHKCKSEYVWWSNKKTCVLANGDDTKILEDSCTGQIDENVAAINGTVACVDTRYKCAENYYVAKNGDGTYYCAAIVTNPANTDTANTVLSNDCKDYDRDSTDNSSTLEDQCVAKYIKCANINTTIAKTDPADNNRKCVTRGPSHSIYVGSQECPATMLAGKDSGYSHIYFYNHPDYDSLGGCATENWKCDTGYFAYLKAGTNTCERCPKNSKVSSAGNCSEQNDSGHKCFKVDDTGKNIDKSSSNGQWCKCENNYDLYIENDNRPRCIASTRGIEQDSSCTEASETAYTDSCAGCIIFVPDKNSKDPVYGYKCKSGYMHKFDATDYADWAGYPNNNKDYCIADNQCENQ